MSDYVFKGGVFDLDGVITQTAQTHFNAWKKTFDEFLEKREGDHREFTHDKDYLPYVDGMPRFDGVRTFLKSRNIDLDWGDPDDGPDKETIFGIGNRKNGLFQELVETEGVEVFDTSVALIKELKEAGKHVGVASSSRNCRLILEKTGLIDLFDAVVGGIVSKELDLDGKPAPDIFITAAEKMGLLPEECFIVEDAVSGVQAGRKGNFSLVVGVSRGEADPDRLFNQGADLVKSDLGDLSIQEIEDWFAEGLDKSMWCLTYRGYDPESERLREALTTVGNGYFCTRGAIVDEGIKGNTHYPGTYLSGLYGKRPTEIDGHQIYNNDLVNCPNWLSVRFRIDDGPFRGISDMEVLDYVHELDLKTGVTSRRYRIRDPEGRMTQIETEQFASMETPHLGHLRYRFTPLNYNGNLILRSALDGTVINWGVERYRDLESQHLQPLQNERKNGIITLGVRTIGSGVVIIMNARHYLSGHGGNMEGDTLEQEGYVAREFRLGCRKDRTVTLEKAVAVYTSRNWDHGDPESNSLFDAIDAYPFDEALERQRSAWADLWKLADICIQGDRFAQKVLRLHAYHLLVTASPHNTQYDVGIPARGWHGEAYRGHVFWDEIFFLPFYNIRFPAVSRAHQMYRYRRLDQARLNARKSGYKGAMFPWQTADDGTEETQQIHYNPKSGEWNPDLSQHQRHVSISIAYNIWSYFYVTDDNAFLYAYGMEMLLEIARFWASIAGYDPEADRYHIEGVMGPDEFHEKYPGSEKGGFKDNAYTNIMTAWLLHKTIETYEHLPHEVKNRVRKKIDFREAELETWSRIVEKMNVVLTEDGLISQFDGFLDLKELDLEAYRKRYGNIHRMDRILKAEGDSPDRYQVIKQADTLMTFYLLAPGQVVRILQRMGYSPRDPSALMKKNYDYYIHRTSHGSTLSFVVHAAILQYLEGHQDDQMAWYRTALESDIFDIQGGTTPEGIHTGVMGGTLDLVIEAFVGIDFYRDHIDVHPCLPDAWHRLRFRMIHRKNTLMIDLTQKRMTFTLERQRGEKTFIRYNGEDYYFDGEGTIRLKLCPPPAELELEEERPCERNN
jgi:beta-phosphoglucomutase family hydrolase